MLKIRERSDIMLKICQGTEVRKMKKNSLFLLARVIRLMPKWKPGTQMDKPVKVKYAIPVSFKLAD